LLLVINLHENASRENAGTVCCTAPWRTRRRLPLRCARALRRASLAAMNGGRVRVRNAHRHPNVVR
jgi:hypothetical protein